ncbi:MAG: adenylate/guanylate cyclase domain-containing protein [Desulfomonilaceae bacterium]|jgi:class 3 adenylate cyclase
MSLERRFFLFLLVPVAVIVTAFGFWGFFFARAYLLDQWLVSIHLQLEKAAHEISMSLNEKLELINLIAKAEDTPDRNITQAFLIQELLQKPGVRFVDVVKEANAQHGKTAAGNELDELDRGTLTGSYTMELCGDFGFCAPVMDPNSPDKNLRIIRNLDTDNPESGRKLLVRISFDSFLDPIKKMTLMEGGSAWLVTSTGQFLAVTDKSYADRKKVGDNGDQLELTILNDIRNKPFGNVFGPGHPPDVVAGFYKIPSINWYIVLISQGRITLEPIIQFRFYYAVAGLLALTIILSLIRIVTRPVVHSISDISEAAAKVQGGDYSFKLSDTRSDEIGQLYRSFNQMVEGLKQRDLIEQTFGRYVDKKVAQDLMSRPEALRLGGEKGVVSIMMSDLRDFTVISEKLNPETVITILNSYFSRMISVIEKHRGIIVDFYGDSIMVFFNGVDSDIKKRAYDAVYCALEMQREMDGFVKESVSNGFPALSMGIGINTGEVVIGNIGAKTRAKYGIVGADVNLTDRIQATASPGKVVVSEVTYGLVRDRFTVIREFEVCLKGVEDQKRLYEIDSTCIKDSCA